MSSRLARARARIHPTSEDFAEMATTEIDESGVTELVTIRDVSTITVHFESRGLTHDQVADIIKDGAYSALNFRDAIVTTRSIRKSRIT